jgi:L-2-hydroxyglutarate oxidase
MISTSRPDMMQDMTIIGGGIVGIATAYRIQQDFPGLGITVLEKESGLATHQTGRNSGVIHAGIYYAPDSLKAEFCRQGLKQTIEFSREHGLPYEQCGKLLVATSADELTRMDALYERAVTNGLTLQRLDTAELQRMEPNITGVGALLSPATGITDYRAITARMAELFTGNGGEIRYKAEAANIEETRNHVTVTLSDGSSLKSRHTIVCAGVQADRMASMCGVGGDFAMVPFKGEYYRLAPRHDAIVKHLIYPIPDPKLPFLGIHLTRMIGGYVTVGPNAV